MSEVTLIESPVANLASIAGGLKRAGVEVRLTRDPKVIAESEKIVLPGVGAFPAAMRWLSKQGIDAVLRSSVQRGAALLGVCLGHQLLFSESDEVEPTRGLGLVPGKVRRLPPGVPAPQIGWNRMETAADPLFDGIPSGSFFYFVHSYRALAEDEADAIGVTRYGEPFVAAVRHGRVRGVQFHPEKSSSAGLRMLRNFVEYI